MKKDETLLEYFLAIHRLLDLAYPASKGRLKDRIGQDAFIKGLVDQDFRSKVIAQNTTTLQEAYAAACRIREEDRSPVFESRLVTREKRKRQR